MAIMKQTFLEILDLMKRATEGADQVDLLVRVGESKLMRLHGLTDGHPQDEPGTVWLVFTGIPQKRPEICFDAVVDLCKPGQENSGWFPTHGEPAT